MHKLHKVCNPSAKISFFFHKHFLNNNISTPTARFHAIRQDQTLIDIDSKNITTSGRFDDVLAKKGP